ncbi:hypothetical protein K4F52_010020 [Lecanicillium sp. MT-2017a]|nr:hypothetical protein K4F52_010020 [Lecanicillium sp. MT-2017a]
MDKLMSIGKEMLEKSQHTTASDNDMDGAADKAAEHAGSSGSKDLFSSVLGAITEKKGSLEKEDIDEEDAIQKHKDVYKNEGGNQDENSLGTAAAMQALKLFNQGQGKGTGQGAFLSLAMGEASKLFDTKAAQGQVGSGADKQNVIQKAGEVAMKMYFKSQAEQQGGLAAMASKFMK